MLKIAELISKLFDSFFGLALGLCVLMMVLAMAVHYDTQSNRLQEVTTENEKVKETKAIAPR